MSLREAWLHCPDGQLALSEQAKLWGLREALRLLGESDDQFAWMAKQVRKSGNGQATGGVSPTMVYAYGFTLCKRAVVVTMDEAAENLGLLESHHWLADRRNVLPFRLSEPAFVQPLV